MDGKKRKHVIYCLVRNRAGILAHISEMFSSRGYNIDSLAVGRTEDPGRSRMTIVVEGDDHVLEQIQKQLKKLLDVIEVHDLSPEPFIERDLVLVRVKAPPAKRVAVLQLGEVFRAKVVDINNEDLILEIAGPEAKVEAMLQVLAPFGILEMVRTGRIAMKRGNLAAGEAEG